MVLFIIVIVLYTCQNDKKLMKYNYNKFFVNSFDFDSIIDSCEIIEIGRHIIISMYNVHNRSQSHHIGYTTNLMIGYSSCD